MDTALTLLLSAMAVAWLAPGCLRRLGRGQVDASALLVAWLMCVVVFGAACLGAVAALLLPTEGGDMKVASAVHGCWKSLARGVLPQVEQATGTAAGVILLALLLRVAVVAARSGLRRARLRRRHLSTLRMIATEAPHDPSLWWVDHPGPAAFSLSGRRGRVVATAGLADRLDEHELAAVIEHERAHLRGHHHALVAVFAALRRALPFLPLFRQAPGAVCELVELAADARAARVHGPRAVHSALAALSDPAVAAPPGALAMTDGAVGLRLDRLARGGGVVPPLRRSVHLVVAPAVAAGLPVLVAVVALAGLVAVSCPLIG